MRVTQIIHDEGERHDEVEEMPWKEKDNKGEEDAQKSDRLIFNLPTYCGVAMAYYYDVIRLTNNSGLIFLTSLILQQTQFGLTAME